MKKPNWEKHADTLIEILLRALGTLLQRALSQQKSNIVTYQVTIGKRAIKETIEIHGVKAKKIDEELIRREAQINPRHKLEIISTAPIKK